jgi:hypothetical protein
MRRLSLLELLLCVKSSRHPILRTQSIHTFRGSAGHLRAQEMIPRTQIRGRPMFLDRRRRRAVLFATGIVCLTISAGCLSSSLARRAPETTSEPAAAVAQVPAETRDAQNRTQPGRTDSSVRSASVQAADIPLAGASPATPFLIAPGPSSPAPAGAFPLELQAVPSESNGKGVPGGGGAPTAGPGTEQPAPASTPLIDAHIQRVADITRHQREAIASSLSPDEIQEPNGARVSSLNSGTQSLVAENPAPELLFKNDNEVVPLPRRLSRSVDDEPLAGNVRLRDDTPKPKADEHAARREPRTPGSGQETLEVNARLQENTTQRKADEQPARRAPRSLGHLSPGAETGSGAQETKGPITRNVAEANPNPAPPTVPKPKDHKDVSAADEPASNLAPDGENTAPAMVRESNPAHRGSLGIGELRLCRSISGFGSFEPLPNERVKAGQSLLVYCELTGLQYEKRDAGGFASRISSRVELKRASGGPVIWEQDLGNAEDKCRRQRRDYYVNCWVDLPKNLPPGSYRLRLLPTDLVAGSATSAEIPLEITP